MNIKEDSSFKEKSYNALDALFFSAFVYLPIGKVDVPTYIGDDFVIDLKHRTLEEISEEVENNPRLFNERFNNIKEEDSPVESERINYLGIIKAMGMSNRYKDLRIIDFNVKLDNTLGQVCQFCAFLIEIEQNKEYVVAYRGTDRTMEGWYEDSKMIFQVQPAQYLALEFLMKALKDYSGIIHITGHSKGGGNAHYAFLEASDYRDRLDLIAFDSLFFNKDYAEINKDKIINFSNSNKTKFINVENSFFGELLYGTEYCRDKKNLIYIKSVATHLMQEHQLYNMQLVEGEFEETLLSYESKLLRDSFRKYICENRTEAEVFFETVFNILGYDTKESVLNSRISNKNKMAMIIKNILAQKDENLMVAGKVLNNLYSELNQVFEFNKSAHINEILDESTSKAKEDNRTLKRIINKYIMEAFNPETIDDVKQFKLNIEVVGKLLGEYSEYNEEAEKLKEIFKRKKTGLIDFIKNIIKW
ncbi:MAG: Mbeg1-like protein [Lachnospirales bacterium]